MIGKDVKPELHDIMLDIPGEQPGEITDITVEASNSLPELVDIVEFHEVKFEATADVEVLELVEVIEGAFGWPCANGSECLSGFCIEHLGSKVCTQTCNNDCPEGWQCIEVNTGEQVASICVSTFSFLCRPCLDSAECATPQGMGGAYVTQVGCISALRLKSRTPETISGGLCVDQAVRLRRLSFQAIKRAGSCVLPGTE